jgi:hypothetical protein
MWGDGWLIWRTRWLSIEVNTKLGDEWIWGINLINQVARFVLGPAGSKAKPLINRKHLLKINLLKKNYS